MWQKHRFRLQKNKHKKPPRSQIQQNKTTKRPAGLAANYTDKHADRLH